MSGRIARHLRANVVGYVAVFIALSGTAVALPGKNKVDSNDLRRGAVKAKALKDGAVTNPKLREGAVTSAKVDDGSLVGLDLGDATLTDSKLADNAVTRPKIVEDAINAARLANSSVNSGKVDNGSLQAQDFAAGQLSDGFTRTGDGQFTLPRAGRVFVSASFLSSCSTACVDDYSVEIDDTIVPGADFVRAGDDDLHVTLTGVTSAPLAAGSHTIQLAQTGDAGETAPHFAGILLQ
jgi:hypothetical protein